MNIKTRLTLQFTAIVGGILLVFSVFTYQFSAIFRQTQFSERLHDVSYNVVSTYLDHEELTPKILRLLYKESLNRFHGEQLFIADEKREIIFSSAKLNHTDFDIFEQLYKKGTYLNFEFGDTDYVAYPLPHNGRTFYVVDYAIDSVGKLKLSNLRLILFLLTLTFMMLASVGGWYFSSQALQPIKDIVSQVDLINESNLSQRLKEGNGKDEIAALTIVFNHMLERIEKSFGYQKLFIANASHEFRTPLTSMHGQLEVLLKKDRSKEEYIQTLHSIQEDVQNLRSLINGLSELAQANADFPNVKFTEVSLVEVIMEAREELLKRKPEYKIGLKWGDFPEEDEGATLMGDFPLLKSAFTNLFDNGCKFSDDNTCKVEIVFSKLSILIKISNQGSGIPADDIEHVFEPFFRSNETRKFQAMELV